MAKTSSIEKNNKRKQMVKQVAAKRTRLKAIAKDQKLSLEERFAALDPRNRVAADLLLDRDGCPARRLELTEILSKIH